MYKTKKFFVVLMEFVGGVSLGLLALCLPLPDYFRYSIAFFALIAFCSSTHDIAADGLYIGSLSPTAAGRLRGMAGRFLQHCALRFAGRTADPRRLPREPHAGGAGVDDHLRHGGNHAGSAQPVSFASAADGRRRAAFAEACAKCWRHSGTWWSASSRSPISGFCCCLCFCIAPVKGRW